MTSRQLHLNVNANALGRSAGGWRLRDDPLGFLDLSVWEDLGRTAERGLLDAVFLAETHGFSTAEFARPWNAFDPFVTLTAIARATEHIGLVATVSSTYRHPYHIARLGSSLDHASGGRAAINVVTTMSPRAGAQFGLAAHPDYDTRYARADEAIQVITALWDSWEPDALVADRTTGLLTDPDRVREVDFRGEHLSVRTHFQLPRSPQGRPVLLQAGASTQGIELAAKYADAVFCAAQSIDQGARFYRTVKDRAAAHGRDGAEIHILPGLFPIIGSTEAEARERHALLTDLDPNHDQIGALANTLGLPPESLVLDRPLPWDLVDAPGRTPRSHGFANAILETARAENLTVRALLARDLGAGHRVVVGTPEQIADDIERYFTARAADGFNLNIDYFPDGLERIVDQVIPILQRRGLFRTEYAATTLRGNLGLPIVAPAAHRSTAVAAKA
ncbi:NtaA/DmoA family FMN-dependent monooxygenase [Nocardia sp. NPDC058176]|uniref:NtaA/DmoA family FMN-dependent monooxygenase n=1 Tax=Nocardia sp. NPDC058176 TaxID=3346368 RepID=UPI0036DD5D6F